MPTRRTDPSKRTVEKPSAGTVRQSRERPVTALRSCAATRVNRERVEHNSTLAGRGCGRVF